MEDYVASEQRPIDVCLKDVASCDVYVGIFAQCYGFIPKTSNPEWLSITELEYREAGEKGKPRLVFLLREGLDWPRLHSDVLTGKHERGERIAKLRRTLEQKHTVSYFSSADDLSALVCAALVTWEKSSHEFGRRDFYRHVALPPNLVPRKALLRDLRLAILTGSTPLALISGASATATALHGMGGIGKTVIARALCDDVVVQRAFPDGILWATLGKDATETDVFSHMTDWLSTLAGSGRAEHRSLSALKNSLGQLLSSRSCLLVIDDAWRHSLVDHFRIGGPRCRLMLTTRNAEVAAESGADVHAIPLMTQDEALALLSSWAGRLTDGPGDIGKEIVDRIARLPLATKLAGVQLRREEPRAWLRQLNVAMLKTNRPETIHDSLELTFRASIDDLPDEERLAYSVLVIFKEDQMTSEHVVARLWRAMCGLEASESAKLLDKLASLALLDLVGKNPRRVALHDLLRDFLREDLREQGAAAAHDALLNSYCVARSATDWIALPNDGYLFDHLAYHLLSVGRREELYELLTGSWEWAARKSTVLGGDLSYVADLDRTIEALDGKSDEASILQITGLIAARAAVRHRAEVYSDLDLEILCLLGRTAEAASHATLRSAPLARCVGLATIYDMQVQHDGKGNDSFLQQAIMIATGLAEPAMHSKALCRIIDSLYLAGLDTQREAFYPEALAAAKRVAEPRERSVALQGVARRLIQAGRLSDALAAMDGDIPGSLALAADVVTALAQRGDFDQALLYAQDISSQGDKNVALAAICVAMIAVGQHDRAHELASKIENFEDRVRVTCALAIRHAKADRLSACRTLAQLRQSCCAEEPALARTSSLVEVARALHQIGSEDAESVLKEAEELGKQIEDWLDRQNVFGQIVSLFAQMGNAEKASSLSSWGFGEHDYTGPLVIAKGLVDSGKYDAAMQFIEHLWQPHNKHAAVAYVSKALALSGQLSRARTLFDDLMPEMVRERGAYLGATESIPVGTVYVRSGQPTKGIQIANLGVRDNTSHCLVCTTMGAVLASAAFVKVGLRLVRKMTGLSADIVDGLCAICVALPPAHRNTAKKVLAESYSLACRIETEYQYARDAAFVHVGVAAIAMGKTDLVEQIVGRIVDQHDRKKVMIQQALAKASESEIVRLVSEVADMLKGAQVGSKGWATALDISLWLAQAGRADDAMRVLRPVSSSSAPAAHLEPLIVELAKSASHGQLAELARKFSLEDACRMAQAILKVGEELASSSTRKIVENIEFWGPDQVMAAVSQWAPMYDNIAGGVAVKAVRRAAKIVGAIHPGWQEVSAVIEDIA